MDTVHRRKARDNDRCLNHAQVIVQNYMLGGLSMTFPTTLVSLVLLLTVDPAIAVDGNAAKSEGGAYLNPSDLLTAEPQTVSKTVSVRGVLENLGTNAFTDSRLVLKDSSGTAVVPVQPMLPTEVGPGKSPGFGPSSMMLQDFLGKEVIVTGSFDEGHSKAFGAAKVLRGSVQLAK